MSNPQPWRSTISSIRYPLFYELEGACAPIAPCGLRSVASLHPRCGEGKIEEALLVAVGRDVLVYKESCVGMSWWICLPTLRKYVLVNMWFAVLWGCWSCSTEMSRWICGLRCFGFLQLFLQSAHQFFCVVRHISTTLHIMMVMINMICSLAQIISLYFIIS